ncbi:MAG: ErfK/YbiS/YcfS/YnhG family protein, partial [Gemmatimonadetes bacterium]|nr:ErfK/YbiS/YcfS/YnhG family protein [Gemmatimonadota bacterium]
MRPAPRPTDPSPASPLRRGARLPLVALLLALLFGAGLEGCGQLKKLKPGRARYKPTAVTKVLNVQIADLTPAIAARIAAANRPEWVTEARWAEVRKLYTQFDNAPLWLEEAGMKDRVRSLLAALEEAPDHALDTTAYPITEIRRAASETRLTDSASAIAIADADVLLTAAYVAYADDMLTGQVDPKTVSQSWHIGSNKTELDSALIRSLQDSDMTLSLREMAPQDQDYAALRVAYARYREIAAKGGWPEIPATGGAARMAGLHARLDAELAADSIGYVAAP